MPELSAMPMPEGERHIDRSHQEELEAQDFAKMLSANRQTFEDKGFDVFNDRILLEVTYHHLLKAFSGEEQLDVSKIVAEAESHSAMVELAIKTIKSIVGMPDVTPPDGEPSAGARSAEDEDQLAA